MLMLGDRPVALKILRTVLYIALVPVLWVLWAGRHHSLPYPSQDWALLALGCVLIVMTALDVKDGTATLIYAPIERAKDPTGFWAAIVIGAGLGGAAAIVAASDLLRL